MSEEKPPIDVESTVDTDVLQLAERLAVLESEVQRHRSDDSWSIQRLTTDVQSLESMLMSSVRRTFMLTCGKSAPSSEGESAPATDSADLFTQREKELEKCAVQLETRAKELSEREARAEHHEKRLEAWQARLQQESAALQSKVRQLEATLGSRERGLNEREDALERNTAKWLAETRALEEKQAQHAEAVKQHRISVAKKEEELKYLSNLAQMSLGSSAAQNGQKSARNGDATADTKETPKSELEVVEGAITQLQKQIHQLNSKLGLAVARRAFLLQARRQK